MRLLVTRPLPEAEETARALAAIGHETLVEPLLAIELDIDAPIPDEAFAGILVTSGNALAALGARPDRARFLGLDLYAVGARTAERSRAMGFARIRSAGGTGADLAALVLRAAPAGRLLYPTARHRSPDLERVLAEAGRSVLPVEVYRSRPVTRLSPALIDAFRGERLDGVVHFSPRTAEAFVAAIRLAGLEGPSRRLVHFCLSDRVAAVLAGLDPAGLEVADAPDVRALIARIGPAE